MWLSLLRTPRCHLGLDQEQGEEAEARQTRIYLKELSKEAMLLNQTDIIGLPQITGLLFNRISGS